MKHPFSNPLIFTRVASSLRENVRNSSAKGEVGRYDISGSYTSNRLTSVTVSTGAQVYDRKTSKLVQRTDYYSSGEPWLVPTYGNGASGNRYLFGGKERMAGGALNEYDFEARNYVASFQRFTTIDPLTEATPSISPYAYCNANPINFIDPTGTHIQVTLKSPGVYQVVGGELDDDLNVYLYCENEDGELVNTGISIGVTVSETSFYDSDVDLWKIDSYIDMNDNSGIAFVNNIIADTPTLPDYMDKARNGHPFDFKVTNGSDSPMPLDEYRGMPIGKNEKGLSVIASARDIGNFAAGYTASANGLSWKTARMGFDIYQSMVKKKYSIEGPSTQNAEFWGWQTGQMLVPAKERERRMTKSIGKVFLRSSRTFLNLFHFRRK